MDISYSNPTIEELQKELHNKNAECQALYAHIEKREREFLERLAEVRKDALKTASMEKETDLKYYKEELERVEYYNAKKARKEN